MGVAQSTEGVLTAIVLAGALGLGYYHYHMTPTPTLTEGGASTSTSADANSVKKSKKKKKKNLEADKHAVSATSSSQLASDTIPGQFDQPSLTPTPTSNSKVNKKPKKKSSSTTTATKQLPVVTTTPSSSSNPTSQHNSKSDIQKPSTTPTAANATEGTWTRVVSKRNDKQGTDEHSTVDVITTSDAGLTSSVTGNSSPTEEEDSSSNLQTLAEKLVPKNPKTKVDDMLPDHNQPTISRVIRVQPLPDEKPAPGFSWKDYEDVDADGEEDDNDDDDDDDGWGVVKSKHRSRPHREPNASASTSTSTTTTQPTQRQRQNAKKRQAQKAAKEATENDRLAALAKHKRELEKVRIIEQSRSGGGGKTGGKVSGGMAPVVDAGGKLVWE